MEYRQLTTSVLAVLLMSLVGARAYPQDRYFKEDFYTGARYLRLSVDGSYEIVDREHMGVWIAERGRWTEEDDATLVFVSDQHVNDIVAQLGRVSISGPGGASLLPELRIELLRLLEARPAREEFLASALSSLEIMSDGGRVSVELDPVVTERGTVSGQEIRSLMNAIDEYLLSQLHHVSRRRLENYRGIRFLVSLGDGVRAPILDAEEIRTRVDELDGRVPAHVLAEITEDLFEREHRATYPFRYLRPK